MKAFVALAYLYPWIAILILIGMHYVFGKDVSDKIAFIIIVVPTIALIICWSYLYWKRNK